VAVSATKASIAMKAKRMGILLWFTAPLSAFSLQRDVMRVTKMLFYSLCSAM
jgi:hypothetical protein